jgi:MscS family membrane protein
MTNLTLVIALLSATSLSYGAVATATDPLQRSNPRSAVTAFLEACHEDDYNRAAQYLDLSRITASARARQGPKLAKDLESVLNSAADFQVLRLSKDPQGNLTDDPDPNIEHVTTTTADERRFVLDLQRNEPAAAPAIWVFSPTTVLEIPELIKIPASRSRIEGRLPPILVETLLLETPLWKWIALLLAAFVLIAIFRLLVGILNRSISSFRLTSTGSFAWIQAIVNPFLVLLSVISFRIIDEIIAPSALTRLYIGRLFLFVVVAAFAWGLINLLDYLILRLDRVLDRRQRLVSRSVIYLGRRVAKTVIGIFAAILVLDNWGFNMTALIAGLGVGGIAVALAAQQTLANVFGGISVIGDAPVMVGDYGNFGGVIGTVEEIGLRSARIRTLNRTVVSIPNSAFAGANLENFELRDKILFNPNFAVKRTTPKDAIRYLLKGLREMLQANKYIEVGPSPVRISAYAAASFTIEIFAYVLTPDIDEYYQHQAELYLAIDEVVASTGVELV